MTRMIMAVLFFLAMGRMGMAETVNFDENVGALADPRHPARGRREHPWLNLSWCALPPL